MKTKRYIVGFILLTIGSALSAVIYSQEFQRTRINIPTRDDLEFASRKNSGLKTTLSWTFGSKRQQGWHLYSLLIQKALKTDADVDSEAFAAKVAEWQTENGLPPNGIIDRVTLFSFIKFWQAKRIRPIAVAPDEKLVSAPISNFFDPTRDSKLLKVEKNAFKAYKEMIDAAAKDKSLGLQVDRDGYLREDEKFLKIISSYRSPEYQASLRKKEPNAGRAQIAVNSPHFTGRALDIYVGGEPVTSKDFNRAIQVETPEYKWLVKNAEKFGFFPYFFEPWHWEYAPEFKTADD